MKEILLKNRINSEFRILRLSEAFYKAYPNPPFTEILKKKNRAYDCLLLQTHRDYLICIPFRTEISHSYAFHFKRSIRSRNHRSGLDYSKIIIIKDSDFIEKEDAVIDHDEYAEVIANVDKIKMDAEVFVNAYCSHISGENLLHEREFDRRYHYSPLKYFHNELGIGVK